MSLCVCGSGLESDLCCAPILAGKPAPTAVALMRSRYTAYTKGNIDYIEASSAPEALADFDRLEAERFVEDAQWLGLEVRQTTDGGEKDETGAVEYVFSFSYKGHTSVQHEIARFCRIDGAWKYQSAIDGPKIEPAHVVQIGRNDPCPCGSGKKYKKCCGG